MIYLIGGAPRVGKSQLAQKLIEARPMESFSLDFMYDLDQVKQIPNFEGASILDKGRSFYPTLKELLVDVAQRSEDCVIEGEVILPEYISELSTAYDIRCCFLGLSHTNLKAIIEHGGYFNWPQWKLDEGLEAEVTDLAERTASRSAIIQQEAAKYGLPYFDLADDYENSSQSAIECLLSGI